MKRNIIALLIATSIVGGTIPYSVNATELIKESIIINQNKVQYKEGIYKVKNETLKIDEDKVSAARSYIGSESTVEINENNISATIELLKSDIMTDTIIKVNKKEVKYTKENKANNQAVLKFNLESLDDDIEVSTTINMGFMKMNVSFRVALDYSNIPVIEEKPEVPEEKPEVPEEKPEIPEEKPETPEEEPDTTPDLPEEKPDTTPENKPESKPENNYTPSVPNVSESTTIYKIQNEILTDSAIGYNAARSAVNSTSYLEEKNGVKYITLGFSQLDVMSNIKVQVNNQNVQYEIVRRNNDAHTMDIKFKIPSIESKVTINAYINVTGMNISFGIDFLENTMKKISQSEINKPLATPTNTVVTSTGNSQEQESDKTESSEIEITKLEAKQYFKKYTIENEIISDSAMGKSMTRKYLDKISILEEIDGDLYLTIKFSGTNAMDNIKITVDGEEASYEIVASDDINNIKAFRFKLNDIKDEIRMYMHIKPIKMDIDFGIGLIEESKTLVEEGTKSDNDIEANKEDIVLNTLLETNNNTVNTKKIVIKTVAITTFIIFMIQGIIYLLIKRRRNKLENKE